MKIIKILLPFLLLTPLVVLGYRVYDPSERAELASDRDAQGTVGYMARTIEAAALAAQPVPFQADELGCAKVDGYCYVANDEGFIVYTLAKSLTWKEYCHQNTTYILHSSVDNFNGIVCVDPPKPGKQKFINS